ncbi:MAG: molybdopterin-dependent oxidoreductase [Pirellulaceae bacterium]|nr:molybdopterin-dependent oxidoreductase [Pirellulaceae bacterium]
MHTPPLLSRRDLLLAGGGIAITGMMPIPLSADQPGLGEKDLIFRTTVPRNAEPSLDKLVQSWITPTKHFYVRSHAPNPVIDAGSFELSVEGMVRQKRTFKLAQLLSMQNHTITATLTCAGNRRDEFNREGKVGGVQWQAGAIGNATWTGVALSDVLKQVEVLENAKHVWFEGLDEIEKGDDVIPFGGSIPIEKAMIRGAASHDSDSDDSAPGALLAHQMNGAALTPDHGYPLRTIVPGYIGARSVKWLGKIVVSDRPSPNHYVATAYKIVRATDPIDWSESGPIYRFPINAAIATPAAKTSVPAGMLAVTGYALPSGRPGAKLTKVLVSADDGDTWTTAKLTGQDVRYCWQLWKASVRVTTQTTRLLVKAQDSAGGFMPGRVPWNAKGYLQNSWYKLPLQVS